MIISKIFTFFIVISFNFWTLNACDSFDQKDASSRAYYLPKTAEEYREAEDNFFNGSQLYIKKEYILATKNFLETCWHPGSIGYLSIIEEKHANEISSKQLIIVREIISGRSFDELVKESEERYKNIQIKLLSKQEAEPIKEQKSSPSSFLSKFSQTCSRAYSAFHSKDDALKVPLISSTKKIN